ncbi:fibronectin type III domain-containing protein [Maribacter flavus]|uniref:Fibronectin type III domain-containing protein n=1 Tax=Maribacter flavus TaxID=1658664 RepID=A0A5B2TVJ8_9FLAO|nr:fibronectin type III domain-containing protein [Maribacter flavus]KAA2218269.1 fibronectin type III domain-containing protein [Maribacter flavus]
MKRVLLALALVCCSVTVQAQSDVIDVTGPTDGLLLKVKTTAQINSINNPIRGLLLGNDTTKSLWYYDGTQFIDLMASAAGADWNSNLLNIPADIADGDDDTIADGSETKVTAGTNTTVTGTGTIGSPYQIGLSGVILADGTIGMTNDLNLGQNNIDNLRVLGLVDTGGTERANIFLNGTDILQIARGTKSVTLSESLDRFSINTADVRISGLAGGGNLALRVDNNGELYTESIPSGSGSGDFLANGTVPMTGNLNLDGNNIISGGTINADWLTATNTVTAGQFTGGYARLNRASDPGNDEGNIYVNSVSKLLRYYNGTSWVDVPGGGGTAAYRNPDIYWALRTNGATFNDQWFETTGEQGKRTVNYSLATGSPSFYEFSTFSSNKVAIIRTILQGSSMVFTSDDYDIIGSGTEDVDITAGATSGVIGVYVANGNTMTVTKAPPAISGTVVVDSYFKPYSISQVTGVASSNITETGFTISWNAANASIGTISNYQISRDGAAPITVNGGTTYTFTGQTPGTTYNINVRGVDEGGNPGPYSTDLSVTTASSFTAYYSPNALTSTPNEVAGTNGITAGTGSDYTISLETTTVFNGSNAVRLELNNTGNDLYLRLIGVNAGDNVTFSWRLRRVGSYPNNIWIRAYTADGWTSDQLSASVGNEGTDVWTTMTITNTAAVDDPYIRLFDTLAIGNEMIIDFAEVTINP